MTPNMINEVTIIAKFTTGTTMDDPAKAETHIKHLLLDGLAKDGLARETPNALFQVEVIVVKAESI